MLHTSEPVLPITQALLGTPLHSEARAEEPGPSQCPGPEARKDTAAASVLPQIRSHILLASRAPPHSAASPTPKMCSRDKRSPQAVQISQGRAKKTPLLTQSY